MVNKKQIRDEYNAVFIKGSKKAIKKYLKKYPWLMDEDAEVIDKSSSEQYQVIAALGVMEDDLGSSVPLSEIVYCLRDDFNTNKSDERVSNILNELRDLGWVEIEGNNWIMTSKGGTICDAFLNNDLGEITL